MARALGTCVQLPSATHTELITLGGWAIQRLSAGSQGLSHSKLIKHQQSPVVQLHTVALFHWGNEIKWLAQGYTGVSTLPRRDAQLYLRIQPPQKGNVIYLSSFTIKCSLVTVQALTSPMRYLRLLQGILSSFCWKAFVKYVLRISMQT